MFKEPKATTFTELRKNIRPIHHKIEKKINLVYKLFLKSQIQILEQKNTTELKSSLEQTADLNRQNKYSVYFSTAVRIIHSVVQKKKKK